MLSIPISISTPDSFNFAIRASRWLGIILSIFKFLPSSAAIIRYVPASILSGITSWKQLCKCLTPIIVMVLVPAPLILAPILFKNVAIFAISGSCAALSIIVFPLAFTAANIMLIVAPTLGKSK